MFGTQLVDTTQNRCFHFIASSVHLDWTSLIWIGLLILIFELVIYTLIRLKNIFVPPRFLIAIMIVSALLLAEALPFLFLHLNTGTC